MLSADERESLLAGQSSSSDSESWSGSESGSESASAARATARATAPARATARATAMVIAQRLQRAAGVGPSRADCVPGAAISEQEVLKPSPAKSQGSEATQHSPGASSHSSVLGEDAGVPSDLLQQLPPWHFVYNNLPWVLICSGQHLFGRRVCSAVRCPVKQAMG